MTAETAVVLPALLLVVVVLVGVLQVASTGVRCVDAARAAARELARGESAATARQAALAVLPGADVTTSSVGGRATVVVEARVPLVGGRGLTAVPLRATAVSSLEHGAPPPWPP